MRSTLELGRELDALRFAAGSCRSAFGRAAVPAERLYAVSGVSRRALQPRHARDPLLRPFHSGRGPLASEYRQNLGSTAEDKRDDLPSRICRSVS